jgi:hypothetical protein
MSSELVTVATFTTPVEADMARNALDAEGIACQITDDAILGLLWQLGNALGVCAMVALVVRMMG